MTKNIGVFAAGTLSVLLRALNECGYSLEHPGTGEIRAWDNNGDMSLLATGELAFAFVQEERGGLQLWRNEAEDVFLSSHQGRPSISFDGFTELEESKLVNALRQQGLQLNVVHEDDEEALRSWARMTPN